MRWLKHLLGPSSAKRHFTPATLDAIQQAIAESEHRHLGEICFAIEGGLPLGALIAGRRARERAQAAFARLGVWNTEHNSGVLVYVLFADRAIEIVADRGISAKVGDDEWRAICESMQRAFAAGDYEKGSLAGVAAITDVLVRHFPASAGRTVDELPDRPVFL